MANEPQDRAAIFVQIAQAMDRKVRRSMIEPAHPQLSVGAQCPLLPISRSSYSYESQGGSAMNLALLRKTDQQYLEKPFFGGSADDLVPSGGRQHGQCQTHPPVDDPVGIARSVDADLPEAGEPARRQRGTRPTPISGATCELTDPIKSGALTSPISRCEGASYISSRSWAGLHERSCPGGFRTRSAVQRSRCITLKTITTMSDDPFISLAAAS